MDTEEAQSAVGGGIPLFVPVRPPTLDSLLKSDVLKFLGEWDKYKERVEDQDGTSVKV